MTEEKLKQYIEEKRKGQAQDAFKVPEGYFDNLCDRVMSQLPEKQRRAKRVTMLHVWRYAAVAVVGALVCTSVFLIPRMGNKSNSQLASAQSETAQETEQAYYDEEYLSDALEYAGVNNNEIALYLTENY